VSTDEVCYCDSDSDFPGRGGYRGEGCEGFGRGRCPCPVEQMVVYEDRVKPVFFAELRPLYDTLEGFVGR